MFTPIYSHIGVFNDHFDTWFEFGVRKSMYDTPRTFIPNALTVSVFCSRCILLYYCFTYSIYGLKAEYDDTHHSPPSNAYSTIPRICNRVALMMGATIFLCRPLCKTIWVSPHNDIRYASRMKDNKYMKWYLKGVHYPATPYIVMNCDRCRH